MKESTPLLSLIVVYRDRDLARVTRFLEALANQTNPNFELIFVDYGSSEKYRVQVQPLAESFPFVRYFYTDTRGMFWNRSHALNTGVSHTKADYIVTIDIDLIFPANFIEITHAAISDTHYLRYSYYYLPKGFKSFDLLDNTSNNLWQKLEKTSNETNYGVLGFHKSVFQKVGGYDEFYRMWGLEDVDFARRIEKEGILNKGFVQGVYIYHQWHKKSQPALPVGWYEQMKKYYVAKHNPASNTPVHHYISLVSERPALQIVRNDALSNHHTFRFESPKVQAFSRFHYEFHLLKPKECLVIKQTFDLIKNNQVSWLSRSLNYFNQILAKIGVSYRWVDIETYTSEAITKQEIKDFLFYFLVNYQAEILDYYFDANLADNELCLIVVKK